MVFSRTALLGERAVLRVLRICSGWAECRPKSLADFRADPLRTTHDLPRRPWSGQLQPLRRQRPAITAVGAILALLAARRSIASTIDRINDGLGTHGGPRTSWLRGSHWSGDWT